MKRFCGFRNSLRKAQATVEYLLLLATAAGGIIIFFILFYKKIIGVFFTLVGLILGAGTPKQS
ncbi:MAG: hypothetical protein ACP5SD_04455 [Elusimicrobiales bacterium]|nr:hypothetical protein [Elusimicrobiales bacterium]